MCDGCMLAVASNKYQEATVSIIKSYFGDIDFIKVLGQREGIPIKPNPYVINEILACANVCAKETIYIGDSGVDAQTASRVEGLTFIGVTWGFRTRKELEDSSLLDRSPIDLLGEGASITTILVGVEAPEKSL